MCDLGPSTLLWNKLRVFGFSMDVMISVALLWALLPSFRLVSFCFVSSCSVACLPVVALVCLVSCFCFVSFCLVCRLSYWLLPGAIS